MKFAILTPDLLDVERAFEADVLPAHKPGRVLPIVEDQQPTYDPATQKLVHGQLSVHREEVRQTWSVVSLSSQELHANAVTAGYPVSPEGFTLRLEEADRALFAQMLALVKEALSLGMITDETPQLIADHAGTRHEVTTLRFRQIMVGYGFHYKTLWDTLTAQ